MKIRNRVEQAWKVDGIVKMVASMAQNLVRARRRARRAGGGARKGSAMAVMS